MKKSSIELLAGAGYNYITFTLIDGRNGERDYNKNTGSLNVNAGIGYRYHFKKDAIIKYLGTDTRYHILNYRNNSGTNLNGNAITLGLIAGINGSY